ncbi:transmembrane 4 L6 family member 19 isoform X1 [Sus scrofa]|uniref:Phosphate cytidylyltransferase 1A, choline n=3 Tax=Sus scrofa TaxID=9823 RepID=A0A8D1H315_PIG|nr:transmembrane 4 L6 family member 19 isoform X1 [Sus scrofa]XP_020925821.1 transmembrane 4 L6 family member 19 isoform X1 [Sus scrofa]
MPTHTRLGDLHIYTASPWPSLGVLKEQPPVQLCRNPSWGHRCAGPLLPGSFSPILLLAAGCRMPSSPCAMACSRTCSRILGLSLGATALFAAATNTALLFPNWDVTYLLRGLIGRQAMLGSGLWGGGLMVLTAAILISLMGWRRGCFSKSGPCQSMLTALLSSGLALFGALICFITSGVALKDGPFCMFHVSSFNQTQTWKYGYPFKDLHNRNYLYDHSLWNSVCLEPSKAVIWHVGFFSVLLCISLLQILLVAIHFINSFLGFFCSLCEK